MLPRAFLRVYRFTFGCDPPEEFVDTYTDLAESLYWGSGRRDVSGEGKQKRGSKGQQGYSFADPRLFPTKVRADKVLAQASAALLRTTFRREGPSGPPAPRARGEDHTRAEEERAPTLVRGVKR